MADNNAKIAEIERDAAIKVAIGEAAQREAAERAALDAQIRADEAERAARASAGTAGMAYEEAESANNRTWTTGILALIVIIGLVIGGAWLYNGYTEKNDKLYNATINNDRARIENQVLAQENARKTAAAQTPSVAVNVSDATANLRRAEDAARPTPAPTPVPEPQVIVVPGQAATPAAEGNVTVESTTTTTTSNGDGSTTTGNYGVFSK